jgi:hypothetical protein
MEWRAAAASAPLLLLPALAPAPAHGGVVTRCIMVRWTPRQLRRTPVRPSSSAQSALARIVGLGDDASPREGVRDEPGMQTWRRIEGIPSPANASVEQSSTALSMRHVAKITTDALDLHVLSPCSLDPSHARNRATAHARATHRVRVVSSLRRGTPRELRPLFRGLRPWLTAEAPLSSPSLRLKPLRGAAAANQVTRRQQPPRKKKLSSAVADVSPIARRRKIQEAAGLKAPLEHVPTWSGTLGTHHCCALRVRYPTLQLTAPIIRMRPGKMMPLNVASTIQVVLSAGAPQPL